MGVEKGHNDIDEIYGIFTITADKNGVDRHYGQIGYDHEAGIAGEEDSIYQNR